jgi:hypothetical protein
MVPDVMYANPLCTLTSCYYEIHHPIVLASAHVLSRQLSVTPISISYAFLIPPMCVEYSIIAYLLM